MRHFTAAHIGVKTYQCEQCEKQFSLKIDNKRHMSNVHEKKMENTRQGFHSWGFSPHCSEFATFAKTVAICGDFHAGIWNVENTETTA